jgi:hypothetical protein
LDHQGVDVDEAGLEQVEAEHGEFLVLATVGGELTAVAVADEAVGGVPVLDHVEAFVDLPEASELQPSSFAEGSYCQFFGVAVVLWRRTTCVMARCRNPPVWIPVWEGFIAQWDGGRPVTSSG